MVTELHYDNAIIKMALHKNTGIILHLYNAYQWNYIMTEFYDNTITLQWNYIILNCINIKIMQFIFNCNLVAILIPFNCK